MILNDKIYTVLKWLVLVVIPACTTAYVGLASVWGFHFPDEVSKTSSIVCTLLGALLGISSAEYNKLHPGI